MTRAAVLGSWHGLSGEFVVATVTWEGGKQGSGSDHYGSQAPEGLAQGCRAPYERPRGPRRCGRLQEPGARRCGAQAGHYASGKSIKADRASKKAARKSAPRKRACITPAVILMGEARGGLLWARYGVQ